MLHHIAVGFLSLIFVFSYCSSLLAAEYKLSGSFLSGFNSFLQSNRSFGPGERNHFDCAFDFNVDVKISPTVRAYTKLQGGPGQSSLGLQGPHLFVRDLFLEYSPENSNYLILMGSFDTPFGQYANKVSNNSDIFGNNLVFNPLLYSALGGVMGTLNSVGMMTEYNDGVSKVNLVFSNGTDETSKNPDNGYEFLISASSAAVVPGMTLGAAFMNSQDLQNEGSGFKSRFESWIVDASIPVGEKVELKSYAGNVFYDDGDVTTEDGVTTWMLEGKYWVSPQWFITGRLAAWNPWDADGSNDGMSAAMPNPGFATSVGGAAPFPDRRLLRTEIGAGIYLEKDLVLKGEVYFDNYAKSAKSPNTDVHGFAVFLNAAF